jgi:hypothetical protein
LRKAIKSADLEAASKTTETAPINQRDLDEGDLFGVRALEKGFFGGVAQSRPSSVANSPRISPTISSASSPNLLNLSTSSSMQDLSLSSTIAASKSPSSIVDAKHRTPTLSQKLRPSEVELSGRKNHDSTISGNVPLSLQGPFPKEPVATTPKTHKHTRTLSQPLSSSPVTHLDTLSIYGSPKLRAALRDNDAAIESIDVEVGSIASKSPPLTLFPPPKSPKRTEQQTKVTAQNCETQTILSTQSTRDSYPSESAKRYANTKSVIELNHLSGISQWGERVRNDLAAQKSPLLSTFNENPFEDAEETSHARSLSSASSNSHYSTDDAKEEPASSKTINTTVKPVPPPKHHNRSKSVESTKSIKRTHDSLRQPRKQSRDDIAVSRRRSLDRDAMHYDPKHLARTRAGSVQGRAVDFDRPRASPFNAPPVPPQPTTIPQSATTSPMPISKASKLKDAIPPLPSQPATIPTATTVKATNSTDTTPTHSANSSASSISLPISRFSTAVEMNPFKDPVPRPPVPSMTFPITGRSVASLADAYDTYYRRTALAQKASVLAAQEERQSGITANGTSPTMIGHPVALSLVQGGAAASVKPVEPVVEVQTPMTSPVRTA